MQQQDRKLEWETRINQTIEQLPMGCLVIQNKEVTNAIFWQRPMPKEEVYWLNMISGVANHAISGKRTTKQEIMIFLDKVLQ